MNTHVFKDKIHNGIIKSNITRNQVKIKYGCHYKVHIITDIRIWSHPWLRKRRKLALVMLKHDDVIKWKHFPRNWPFVRGIHRSPVNSPHKGQWHGALMFSLICARINDWINNREAGDLRRRRAHYDAIVMIIWWSINEYLLFVRYLNTETMLAMMITWHHWCLGMDQ